MKRITLSFLAALFLATSVSANTPPPGSLFIKGATDSTSIGNVGDALKVSNVGGGETNYALETGGNLAAINTKLSSQFQAGQSIGNTSFGISGLLPNFSSTPTFNLGTLNGAALDSTLQSILSQLQSPGPITGTVAVSNFPSTYPVTGTFFQATQPVSIAAPVAVTGTFFQATQPVSGSVSVSNFPSTQAVTGTFFQAVQPVSGTLTTTPHVNVAASGTASTVSTVQTLTAPSNAVGFVLMNLDTSTANIRWSIGRTATTSVGQQLQPGRDTDFIPAGASVSIVAESGTQNFDIQWVSQ